MKVAVLGFGTVGKGVYEMLGAAKGLEQGPVLVRPGKVDTDYKVCDINDITGDSSVDAVAEVMGGIEPAFSYCAAALKAGKHVVTSNKALVAAKGLELNRLAHENNASFLFSAACGGAIPFLHNLSLATMTDSVDTVGGILNGTTNYMLDCMQSYNLSYEAALKDAQKLGYAEADPTADVSGLDALRKIMLSCAVGFSALPVRGLLNEGIENFTADDCRYLMSKGLTLRLLAKGGRTGNGIYAYVEPMALRANAAECSVLKNFNLARYHGKNSGDIILIGQGAGRFPTASAVLRDLSCVAQGQREMLPSDCVEVEADNRGCTHRYLVRLPKSCICDFNVGSVEEYGDVAYIVTEEMSVALMHAMAHELRENGAEIFFAALED